MEIPVGLLKASPIDFLLRFTCVESESHIHDYTHQTYGKVICAFARELTLDTVRIWCIWWAPGSCVVASCGVFDLDHICSDHSSASVLSSYVSITNPRSPSICVQYGYLISATAFPFRRVNHILQLILGSCPGL